MNIVKEWTTRLQNVNKSLDDLQGILETQKLNRDMLGTLNSLIQSKAKYKRLIEETLRRLEDEHKDVESWRNRMQSSDS